MLSMTTVSPKRLSRVESSESQKGWSKVHVVVGYDRGFIEVKGKIMEKKNHKKKVQLELEILELEKKLTPGGRDDLTGECPLINGQYENQGAEC